jgi:sugar phosphate isomerase/epimerase
MRNLSYVLGMAVCLLFGCRASSQTIPKLGIMASIDQDSLLHASGFTMMGESVGRMLSPDLTEAEFLANVKRIKAAKTKVYVCNVLFPGSLKIAGPEVDEQKVLAYVDKVFERANKAGVPLIVLGSGGARRLPENYDYQAATNDFIQLCRKIAMVAEKHGVTVALESLNSSETNFLTTLQEAAGVVKGTNHPNFRLNADIYHMMKENEPPQHIVDAGNIIVYVELAEKEKRTLPGVVGEDFKPYFEALESIGYMGPIFIEGSIKNPEKEILYAHIYLTQQLSEVYKKGK